MTTSAAPDTPRTLGSATLHTLSQALHGSIWRGRLVTTEHLACAKAAYAAPALTRVRASRRVGSAARRDGGIRLERRGGVMATVAAVSGGSAAPGGDGTQEDGGGG